MTADEWLASTDPVRMLEFVHENPDHENITCCRSERKLRLFACACARATDLFRVDDGSARLAVQTAERFADGAPAKTQMAKFGGRPEGSTSLFRHALLGSHCCLASATRAAELMAACPDGPPPQTMALLLRDICGDPFRPVLLPLLRRCWKCHREAPVRDRQATLCHCGTWSDLEPFCPWLTPTVLALASAPYDLRTPDGTLDRVRLCVLADALEEAGCDHLEETWACRRCGKTENVGVWESQYAAKEQRMNCGNCAIALPAKGNVFRKSIRATHPLLAHLRSPGPHVRGCAVLDAILGRE